MERSNNNNYPVCCFWIYGLVYSDLLLTVYNIWFVWWIKYKALTNTAFALKKKEFKLKLILKNYNLENDWKYEYQLTYSINLCTLYILKTHGNMRGRQRTLCKIVLLQHNNFVAPFGVKKITILVRNYFRIQTNQNLELFTGTMVTADWVGSHQRVMPNIVAKPYSKL